MVVTSLDSRLRLLEVGADLFHHRGYAETTLRDIAQDAGMKAGSIYYHFASKEELLTEVLRSGMTAITEAFEKARMATTPAAQPEECFRAAITAHMGALYEYGPFTAAHVTVLSRAPEEVRKQILPLRDSYESLWTEFLSELRERGALRPSLDIHFMRLNVLGAMNSSLEWFDPSGDQPLATLIDQLVDQFWGGLAQTNQKEYR